MTLREILLRHSPIPLKDEELLLLARHYESLVRWNSVMNLTAIRDVESVVIRHYCESLFVAQHLPAGALRIADIGSGPGFPGFPVAVVRPDCLVTLIESHQRKAVFLKEVSRGVPNVRVLARRADHVHETFDWVISRAVRLRDVYAARLATNYAILVGEGESGVPLPWGDRRKLYLCST